MSSEEPAAASSASISQLVSILPSLLDSEQLGPTVKSLFERGRQKEFVTALAEFTKLAQENIQTLCHEHYQVCRISSVVGVVLIFISLL